MANFDPTNKALWDTILTDETGKKTADPGGFILNAKIRAVNRRFRDNLAGSAERAAQAAKKVLEEGIAREANSGRQTGELLRSVKISETKYAPGGGPYYFFEAERSGALMQRAGGFPIQNQFTGGGFYQASVSVGKGVPHAAYWFKGTGAKRKNLNIKTNSIVPAIYDPPGRIYAKNTTVWASENPDKQNQAAFVYQANGIKYNTYSFIGQEDHLHIIRDAKAASTAVVRQGIQNVRKSYVDNRVKRPFSR